jgi:hypothetical protein
MFLRADTTEELVRAQLENNVKFGGQCDYTDFTHSTIDKKWYCWFLIDMEMLLEKQGAKPLEAGVKRGDT